MFNALVSYFRTPQTLPRKKKTISVRRFEAAKHYETLTNWITSSVQTFNDELEYDLPTLRARSRDATINDVYARRYMGAIKNGVLGPQAIRMRMDVKDPNGQPDKQANMMLQGAWLDWGKMASVDGMSWREAQKLALVTAARDGECFIIMRTGNNYGDYGLQLQFVEAERCEESHNEIAPGGNIIRMGIEYDREGRRVAYHFLESHPNEQRANLGTQRRIRVVASKVIHLYDRERSSQGRGFPWLSAAMLQLVHLKEYEKTELVASRVASGKMGFFTRPQGEEDSLGEDDPNDENAVIQEIDPGSFDILPEGYGLESFDPQNPNGNFKDFVKVILRGVSSSVGIAYHTLANDLESASYSSLRQGAIDERDNFRMLQEWMVEGFCGPVFDEWLKMAITSPNAGIELNIGRLSKYNAPEWLPRSWQWIDPAKETTAITKQLDYNLRSKSDVIRGLGREFGPTMAEIAEEQAIMEELGISDAGSQPDQTQIQVDATGVNDA